MLHHANGTRAIELYQDTDYSDPEIQGNIINFNLLRNNGEYIGYLEVRYFIIQNISIKNKNKSELRVYC